MFNKYIPFWGEAILPELVDNGDAAIPELFLVRLNEERLEGVADLVPHVAVREIETRQDNGLSEGGVEKRFLQSLEGFLPAAPSPSQCCDRHSL